ncbi:MAG: hypothetical protein KY455_00265 [Euryarchaeota archaeon]|nr:hypothetical protein [Euryarchaeota archaeon]
MAGRSKLREPTGAFEFLLAVLALVSIGIFLLPHMGVIEHLGVPIPDQEDLSVIIVDVSICVVFGMDFLFRMGRSENALRFVRENFLQPFAAIPLTTPVLSNIQILMVVVIAARFVRAANMVFGERFVQSILSRYSGVLAREITDAVMVRSLETGRAMVGRMHVPRAVADALDRRRGELHGIVQESLQKVPAYETLKRVPGADEIVKKTEDLIVDTLLETLRNERLNVLVANVMDDTIEEFIVALEKKHPGVTLDALGPLEERAKDPDIHMHVHPPERGQAALYGRGGR